MANPVTGFDTWMRNLHALERDIQVQAERAVEAAMNENLTVSNPLTPVRTGYLKSRNQTRWVEKGPTRFTGEYFNDCSYAVFVALGTYKMAARDFVTPGFYAGRKKLLAGGGSAIP